MKRWRSEAKRVISLLPVNVYLEARTQPGADIMPCIIDWCSSFTPPPSLAASSLSIASNFSGKASHFLLIVARCIVCGCRINNYLVRCQRQGAGWQGAVQEEQGGDGGGEEGVGGEGRSSSGPEHHMSISNSVCKTTIN